MTHETAIDLVVDALMDRLDPQEQAELEAHLASCAECAAEAGEMRSMWHRLEGVQAPAPTGETFIRFGRQLERSRRGHRAWPTALKAAAAILLLLGGGLIGRLTVGTPEVTLPPGPDGRAYLLVIRGNEPERRFPDYQQLMGEYRDWAVRLASEGRLIDANKLAEDDGRWISDLAPAGEDPTALALTGYFLIYADDYDEAVRLARESPHIAYGGTIEVRALDQP